MKSSGEDHTLLIVHDRMRRATENLLDYLELQQFDKAEQDRLWNELREAKEELWSLMDRRPRPKLHPPARSVMARSEEEAN